MNRGNLPPKPRAPCTHGMSADLTINRIKKINKKWKDKQVKKKKKETKKERKYSYHLSPYNIITVFLTIFPMLYFSSLWLNHFITGILCLLASLTYVTQPPTPFSDNIDEPRGYHAKWNKSDGKTNTIWFHLHVGFNETKQMNVIVSRRSQSSEIGCVCIYAYMSIDFYISLYIY